MGYLNNATVTVDAILTNKGRQLLAAGGQLNITKFALSDDEIDYDLWNPAHTLGTNYYGAVIENMPVIEALPDESQMMRYKLVTLPKNVIGIPQITVTPGSITFNASSEAVTVTPTTINLDGANSTLGYTAIISDDTVATIEVAPDGTVARPTAGGTATTLPGAGASAQQLNVVGTRTATGPGAVSMVGSGPSTPSTNNPTPLIAADASMTNFIDDEATGITTAGKTITRVGRKFIVRPVPQPVTPQRPAGTIVRALLTIIGNETGGFKTIQITSALGIYQDVNQFNRFTS
jgi:hypothetical protein